MTISPGNIRVDIGGANAPLFIDYETYCDLDLTRVGAYEYINHPSFRLLLLSWAIGSDKFIVHDFTQDKEHPILVHDHVKNQRPVAGFGAFDLLIMRKYLRLRPEDYIDIMVQCAEVGIPKALAIAGEAARCQAKKDPTGKSLINIFCKPNRGKRVMPQDNPEQWERFNTYAYWDGEVARELFYKTPMLSNRERKLWLLDREINDRGIRADVAGVKVLHGLADKIDTRLNTLIDETTGGEVTKVTQAARIKKFTGFPNCTADTLQKKLALGIADPKIRLVAQLRLAGAKASTKKLPRFLECGSERDQRMRGLLQFCGTHTKRWAGRLVQPHNFPRDCFSPLEVIDCLEAAEKGYAHFTKRYKDPLLAISMCLRGLMVPAPGYEFIVADYSSIEARIVAWLAGQQDILDLYFQGADIYKWLASSIYGVPESEITGAQRFIGKTLVLGSGYGLGAVGLNASLIQKGVPTTEDQAQGYTNAYRERFYAVVQLWTNLRRAAFDAIAGAHIGIRDRTLQFKMVGTKLRMRLPSGNAIYYHDAERVMIPAPWDSEKEIPAMRTRDSATWNLYHANHSHFAENACSAMAREIMANGMHRVNAAGYPVVLTVHDEVISEVPEGMGCVMDYERMLCILPKWAAGLPLAAEGKRMTRYGKA